MADKSYIKIQVELGYWNTCWPTKR